MRTFLHVGSGRERRESTTRGFATGEWREVRLDINPEAAPDIVGSLTDMSAVADGAMDALYSSHSIEHLYPHEVQPALAEFLRVLGPDGFAVITCPDLESVCALVAQGGLLSPVYESEAGPIAPIDIIYGHRDSLAAGNLYMAHRCGFTENVLLQTLFSAGFASVATIRRGHPDYDLWAVATRRERSRPKMEALAREHFPDRSFVAKSSF